MDVDLVDKEEQQQAEIEPEVPAEHEEPEEQPEIEEPEAPVGVDFGDDLVDDSGKLLGKYTDANALARAHKSLESTFGRKAGEAAAYRKTLEAAGYTFDDKGQPVAPQAAPAAARPDQPVQDPNLPAGHRIENGVHYNHLDMVVVPDEDWNVLREEDPDEYARLRNQYDTMRIIRQDRYDQDQGQRQQQQMATAKTQVREIAKTQYGFDDAALTELENEVAQTLAKAAPQVQANPDAYSLLMRAAAAERIPAIVAAHQEQIKQILAGNKDAIKAASAKGQKVIALERGTTNAPAPVAKTGNGLTAAEKQMAKDFGISEEDYARNK